MSTKFCKRCERLEASEHFTSKNECKLWVSKRGRQYYQHHKDKIKQHTKKYQENNPDKVGISLMTPTELREILKLMQEFNVTELEIPGKCNIAKPILAPSVPDFKEDEPEDPPYTSEDIEKDLHTFQQEYLSD